jgi:hypothetical protein
MGQRRGTPPEIRPARGTRCPPRRYTYRLLYFPPEQGPGSLWRSYEGYPSACGRVGGNARGRPDRRRRRLRLRRHCRPGRAPPPGRRRGCRRRAGRPEPSAVCAHPVSRPQHSGHRHPQARPGRPSPGRGRCPHSRARRTAHRGPLGGRHRRPFRCAYSRAALRDTLGGRCRRPFRCAYSRAAFRDTLGRRHPRPQRCAHSRAHHAALSRPFGRGLAHSRPH